MFKLKVVGTLAVLILTAGIVWRLLEHRALAEKLERDAQTKIQKVAANADPVKVPTGGVAPVALETPKPTLAPQKDAIYFSGELRPASEAELAFKAGGRLARISVAQGEWVKEGQTLLQLEDREAQAQLKQARAAVEAAKAQASMADDAEKRVKALGEKSALSDQQKMTVDNQARLAQAGLWQVEAALELAELNVANHTLRAPFAGRITHVPSGVGTMVAPGLPQVGIVDTSRWKVLATASLDDGGRLQQGQDVDLSSTGLKEGKVKHISPSLQQQSRRVQFEISALPLEGATLFAGQVVTGVVKVKKNQ